MKPAIHHILGYTPRTAGELNRRATHPRPLAQPSAQAQEDYEVLPEYEKVVELAEAGAPAVLALGAAGTGKTVLTSHLKKVFDGRVAVVAPTGAAALNAGGVTLHSLFKLPPRLLQPGDAKKQDCSSLFRHLRVLIIDLLHRVRVGEVTDQDLALLNSRAGFQPPEPRPITLTPTNATADAINARGMASLPGDEHTYTGITEGRFKLEGAKLPAPYDLTLKVGAPVMLTRNDGERRWVNGTTGIVLALRPGHVVVQLLDGGDGVVDVTEVCWEQFRYKLEAGTGRIVPVVSGTFTQLPLAPAWACTIHKAQGKTLPAVHIDMGDGAFAAGQTYVALSRARSLESITLARPIRRRDILCDPQITAFLDALRNPNS